MSATPSYIHGTTPKEQQRLTILNRTINDRALTEMNLRGDERILDVGSGLGQFSRAMARKVPNGKVIAIERDAEQLAEAKRQANADGEAALVEFRQGDAFHPPLERNEFGTFDVVHTRFVLEHVNDPQSIVQQMVRAARPGGRVILQDDDHDLLRFWPEVNGLYDAWRAYMKTYTTMGNDPDIGRKLVSLLHNAGAQPLRNSWLFFGACTGEAIFDALIENMLTILDGAREAIVEHSKLNESDLDQAIASARAWKQLPDAALWYAISWAEGRKRAA